MTFVEDVNSLPKITPYEDADAIIFDRIKDLAGEVNVEDFREEAERQNVLSKEWTPIRITFDLSLVTEEEGCNAECKTYL